jgi:aspartate/methionine/tyrosine aminotransferase
MDEWEHPLSPNLGGKTAGSELPPIDYLEWYEPRLQAGIKHDLTQSGFQYPWNWDELLSENPPKNLSNPFTDPPLDPFSMIAEREGVSPNQVAGGHGVSQSLLFALLAVLNPDKPRRVAVEMPSYAPVSQFPRALGCEVLPFWRGPAGGATGNGDEANFDGREESPWRLDRAGIEKILPQVGALITTPMLNPSGRMIDADDQQWLADICASQNVGIVSDEVYIDSARGTEHHRPMFRYGDHCVSVNSVTKCYGLGSLRLGWVIGSEEKIVTARRAMHTMQGMLATPSLRLAEMIWPRIDEPLRLMVERCETNLPLLLKVLESHDIAWTPPPTGIFGCLQLPNGWSALDAIEQFADPLGLLVTPCAMFAPQLDGYIRIAWGDEPSSFAESMIAFDSFLSKLK